MGKNLPIGLLLLGQNSLLTALETFHMLKSNGRDCSRVKGSVMKNILVFGLSLAALMGASVLGVPNANAAANCGTGYACIWQDNNYTGQHYWKQVRQAQAVPSTINNMASSAAANGGTFPCTYFYDFAYQNSGSFFVLWSRTLKATNYQDPNLSNGAGFQANYNENWDNRVSRIVFGACP